MVTKHSWYALNHYRPIAIDKDTIENRPMMYIALSYDHRIIDGKEAVGFLKRLKN